MTNVHAKTMPLPEAKELMKKCLLTWCHQRTGNDDEDFFSLLAFLEGAFLKLSTDLCVFHGTDREKVLTGLLDAFTDEEPGPGVITDMAFFYDFCALMRIRMGSFISAIEGYVQDLHPESEENLDRMSYHFLWDSRVIRECLTDYGDVWKPS